MTEAVLPQSVLPDLDSLNASDPYARRSQTFPTLSDEQVDRLRRFGTVEKMAKGDVLFERDQRSVDFFVVLEGQIDIYEHIRSGDTRTVTVHEKHQFTGELDLFNDRKILVGGRMGSDGAVIRVNRANFRRLMTAESDIAEIITRAFILRRVGLISHKQGSVTMLCAKQDGDSLRIERFLRRNGYPLEILDNPLKPERQALMAGYQLTEDDLPAVVIHLGERVVKKPCNFMLAECLGLVEPLDPDHVYDVAVVGGGPAGLSAAVYAASEGCDTLVLEGEAPGGQAGTSSKIENYLGFPTGVSGQALAGRAQVQAQKFGAKIALPYQVTAIDCSQRPFRLTLNNGTTVQARAVVAASGASYRCLDIAKGRRFDNAGVYYAATATEGDLCASEEIIIVGGGNSAGQAAMFLSGKSKHVHILIRGESLASTMSRYLIDRIEASNQITVHTHSEIVDWQGERHLEEVTWENRKTGQRSTKPIRHVFLMLGAVPNTEWLQGCVALDEKGFILTGAQVEEHPRWTAPRRPLHLETSVPGIFAAGDVRAGSTKRVAFAVGDGGMSVTSLHAILAEG